MSGGRRLETSSTVGAARCADVLSAYGSLNDIAYDGNLRAQICMQYDHNGESLPTLLCSNHYEKI